MNLNELTGEWLRLQELAEDETITAEALIDTAEGIQAEIEEEADAVAGIIKQMNANADLLMNESERFAERAESYRNKAKQLKNLLYRTMVLVEKPKFKTLQNTYYIKKTPAALELDEIDVKDLPERFQKVKTEADKAAIKEALTKGEQLPYARLKQGESLIIR